MTAQDHDHEHHHRSDDPHSRIDPYEGDEPMWSGNPNEGLVAEVTGMTPGRAVDIGSGEGADAVWLAQQGWEVTAVEPSPTAMARARAAAETAGVDVTFVDAELLTAPLEAGSFDLVTVCYPALFRTPEQVAERRLAALVAPGGTLLLLTHADVDRERALSHGMDPDDYLDHAAFRDALDEGWTIEQDEARPRSVAGGQGAHHHHDLVLRARRS